MNIVPAYPTRRWPHKAADLSPTALKRLRWMDFHRLHGQNASLTSRHFGISRSTFHTWWKRYDPEDLKRLEERSRRPHNVRRRQWSMDLVVAVRELRQAYPRWGKDKLVVLLRAEGVRCSTSTVGRVLDHLKKTGQLRELPTRRPYVRRRHLRRPHAIRKPKDYVVRGPGYIVEVDTLDIRPRPGVVLKQFTARDVCSRWDVVEVHTRATATLAAAFLDTLTARMPFPIQAIQVDGGSEFMAEFEEECQRRAIRLFCLPPRSPKLNGHVERANRTHLEEFWRVAVLPTDIVRLNQELRRWEKVYNTLRPHQALGYLTPQAYLTKLKETQ